MSSPPRPRVVIVGAGFGGLWAARALAQTPVDALLVDRNNYHAFLPLLYQVAAAELEPEDIAYPVRSILRTLRHARFALADVEAIDLAGRVVKATERSIPYDFLILATGSVSHFFGVPGAARYAFPLKTMEQGIGLRNHILGCFERAAHEPSAEGRRRALTFAIVGGGPTGVEFAGALAELIRGPLRRDFPGLDPREVCVVLLEAREGIPPGLPEGLRAYTEGRLRRMGVEVRVRAVVAEVTPHAVHLRDGTVIPTETVVWTAGVRGDPSARVWGLPTAADGRVKVLPTLQVPNHPEVYVVGDLACVEEGGRPLPMVAPVAIQQGVAAARNILRQVRGADPQPFRYRDRGTMVAIGRNAAVACLGRRRFSGFPAWIVWLSVHIFKLIGFRNRLLVMINWAWDYLFYERAVRLILPLQARPSSQPAAEVRHPPAPGQAAEESGGAPKPGPDGPKPSAL
ncbi:MAG TPA: NAD(P)/FAD-dependent oxidoreductase [Candidatus Sulfotelmatobacter sp.]|nr:NAD(P)/FAD-dependent oxidoreductase [Candidatus Sulfotelmatobacter sp.]